MCRKASSNGQESSSNSGPQGQTLKELCAEAAVQGVGFEQGAFYDTNRLTQAEFRSRRGWCRPQMPAFQKKNKRKPDRLCDDCYYEQGYQRYAFLYDDDDFEP